LRDAIRNHVGELGVEASNDLQTNGQARLSAGIAGFVRLRGDAHIAAPSASRHPPSLAGKIQHDSLPALEHKHTTAYGPDFTLAAGRWVHSRRTRDFRNALEESFKAPSYPLLLRLLLR